MTSHPRPDPDQFTAVDIQDLLDALSERLSARGVAATVYLVGGAAIALHGLSPDRRTADVDALVAPEAEVLAEAAALAAERGIRATWLNTRARPWIPTPPQPVPTPARAGLDVRTAPVEHLLAMKVLAARGRRDMADIVVLAAVAGVSTADGLVDLALAAYGRDAIETVHGGMADLAATCRVIEQALRGR